MDCWKKFWKTPTIHDDSRFHGTSDSLHVGLVTLRFYSQARKGVKVVGPSVVDRTVRTAWMYKNVMIDGYRNDDMMIWMDMVWNQAISSTLHCLHNEHGAYWSCFVEVFRTQLGSALLTWFFEDVLSPRFLRLLGRSSTLEMFNRAGLTVRPHFPVERPGGFGETWRMERKNATGPFRQSLDFQRFVTFELMFSTWMVSYVSIVCCLNRFHVFSKLSKVVGHQLSQTHGCSFSEQVDEIEPWSRLEQSFY